MQAYEFSAAVHDGMIRIPEQYQGELLSPVVRVILLSNPAAPNVDASNEKFTAMKLQTKEFTFNREEANER
jgi:hypothetical protein